MHEKLKKLADIEGYDDVNEFLEANIIDSVVPGICTAPDCDYTTNVEPDCARGYCEECKQQTVKSALILAGVI